jgi:protease-4
MLPDLSGSFAKLGIAEDGVFSTTLSRFVLGRPVPPGLLEALARNMERIYEVFTGRVLEKRPLAPEELPRYAGGRVWSGKRALENRLVDSLGTLDDAVRLAESLAGASLQVKHYPEQEDLLALLFSGQISPRDLLPLLGQESWIDQAGELLEPQAVDPRSLLRSEWDWEVLE